MFYACHQRGIRGSREAFVEVLHIIRPPLSCFQPGDVTEINLTIDRSTCCTYLGLQQLQAQLLMTVSTRLIA